MTNDACNAIAGLAVDVGANVQPDQPVVIATELEQQQLAHAMAKASYARGARYVDVIYFDYALKLMRLERAKESTLSYVPPWQSERFSHMVDQKAAYIISYTPQIGLLTDIDPRRLALDTTPRLAAQMTAINSGTVNWTYVAGATPRWATALFPKVSRDRAIDSLWGELAAVYRLNSPDPSAEWRRRLNDLERRAALITDLELDRIKFIGPGTDLSVGLLKARWVTTRDVTATGVEYVSNLPTEELLITPDPSRAEGVVSASMPLALDGVVIDDLRITFRSGTVIDVDAASNSDLVRKRVSLDEGASRLGEVALVEAPNPISTRDRLFMHTLFDENAATHLALGAGYARGVDRVDLDRINRSAIHIDFMIGRPELVVVGSTPQGDERILMRDGLFV